MLLSPLKTGNAGSFMGILDFSDEPEAKTGFISGALSALVERIRQFATNVMAAISGLFLKKDTSEETTIIFNDMPVTSATKRSAHSYDLVNLGALSLDDMTLDGPRRHAFKATAAWLQILADAEG